MKKIVNVLFALLMITLTACENEVELSGDYIETPVIYGLLNSSVDTQFVRINKTFLQEGESAVNLAEDPSNINYQNILPTLERINNNEVDTLRKILKPKEPGVFSSDSNYVYYTTKTLISGETYRLNVRQQDEIIAAAETDVLAPVVIRRPSANDRLSFVNTIGQQVQTYIFAIDYTSRMAKIELKMYFLYAEIVDGVYYPRRVEIPIAAVNNIQKVNESNVDVSFNVDVFFDVLERNVPNTNTVKEISCYNNIIVEAVAADEDFMFFQDVNGPIEGISQVRPEYSNIENGLGLFASRSKVSTTTYLTQQTVNYLINSSPVAGRGWQYQAIVEGCN